MTCRYIIHTKEGFTPIFRDKQSAEQWLADNGWIPRVKQPGEYVKLLDSGNEFAGLRRADYLDIEVNRSAMSQRAIRGE